MRSPTQYATETSCLREPSGGRHGKRVPAGRASLCATGMAYMCTAGMAHIVTIPVIESSVNTIMKIRDPSKREASRHPTAPELRTSPGYLQQRLETNVSCASQHP